MKKIAMLVGVAGLALAANAQTFGPGTGATIADNVPAGTAMGNIAVAGQSANIASISFELTNLTHTWVGDLIATVTYTPSVGAPISATLMSRVGSTTVAGVGDSSNLGGNYTFSDTGSDLWALVTLPANGSAFVAPSGNYRATGALSSTPVNLNSVFGGVNGNGTWGLTISDNAAADTGALGSWSLTIVPVPAPGAAALLGLGGLVAFRRRRA
jgi:hypothetical protein